MTPVFGTCGQCAGRFSGKENHCTLCHETFATERGGDSHRTGAYDPPGERRCRSAEEMLAGGMWLRLNRFDTFVWHGTWNKAGVQRRRRADAPSR